MFNFLSSLFGGGHGHDHSHGGHDHSHSHSHSHGSHGHSHDSVEGADKSPSCDSASSSHSHSHDHGHSHGNHGHSHGFNVITFEDAEKWAKEFEKPERETWQRPQEIVNTVVQPLTEKFRNEKILPIRIADIGCGTGYLLARLVNTFPSTPSSVSSTVPTYQLIGTDVEEGMRNYCTKRFTASSHVTISAPTSNQHAGLAEPVHIMILMTVYHHISLDPQERTNWLRSTYEHDMVSSPYSALILIEHKTGELPIMAPPDYMRLSVEQVQKEAKEAGLCCDSTTYASLLPYHEIHILTKA